MDGTTYMARTYDLEGGYNVAELHAGDILGIGPHCGVHGHGDGWYMLVSQKPGLVEGRLYVRVVKVDDIERGPVTTFYIDARTVIVRPQS